MGVVYLATHQDSGRRVALKTLLTDDPRRIERLQREIAVVRSLKHPGVVSLVDSGDRDGRPWFAMELLSGRTLTRHIETLHGQINHPEEGTADTRSGGDRNVSWSSGVPWAGPDASIPPSDSSIALYKARAPDTRGRSPAFHSSATVPAVAAHQPRLLAHVGQLCQTLSYLHGLGLVHADIKPDNIFVTSGGRVVLMDFGLAAEAEGRIDSLTLERIGQRAGTACYTSPEQVKGNWLDARADLYAVGCVLVEILTGQPPFHEGSLHDIMEAHISARPPLSKVAKANPGLVEIVELLLAKRPEARPSRASEVVEAIKAAGIDVPSDPDAPEADPYLLRPPLVGRTRTMDALASAVSTAPDGRGSAHLLSGPSGVGKTRLALEVSRLARADDFVTLGGRCMTVSDRQEPAGPLHAFRALGHRLASLRERHPESFARAMGDRGQQILGAYFPSLATDPAATRPPSGRPHSESITVVVDALLRALSVWADGSPLLFVLDDVQWADEVSVAALARIMAEARSSKWVILALASDAACASVDAIREASTAEHPLGPLNEAGTEAMLRATLASDTLPTGLVTGILHHSHGNPFQIGEAVRTLIDGGILVRVEGVWTLSSSASTTFQGLASNRVARLEPDAQLVCAAAATLGSQFDQQVLREVADLPEARFRDALGALLRSNVLGQDDTDLTFVHDRLRTATLDAIREGAQLHLRAAHALAARNRSLARQAHHLEIAGRLDLARELYWRAALQAHAHHAPREAERLFRCAITADDISDTVTAQIHCDFVERSLLPQGGLEEAEAALATAKILARNYGERPLEGRISMLLGEVYEKQGKRRQGRRCVQDALRVSKELSDTRGEAKALNALGESFRSSGDIDTARRLFEVSLTAFEEIGDRSGMASVANNLAIVHRRQGDYDLARALPRGPGAL